MESGLNQTYDVTTTDPILQEEFNSSCNDTTNDDDEFITVHSQNSDKKSIKILIYIFNIFLYRFKKKNNRKNTKITIKAS